MQGIDDLRRDHDLILVALDAMVGLARKVSAGSAPAKALGDLLTFFRDFADTYHHAKEEEVLFPALEEAGFPRDGGPVGVMLFEHEQGRELLRRLGALVAEGPQSGGALLDVAQSYHALLTQHIFKENNVLFGIAEAHLSASAAVLTEKFAQIEAERLPADRRAQFEQVVRSASEAAGTAPGGRPPA